MRLFRTTCVTMLAVAISTSVLAGDLQKSINGAVEQQEQRQKPQPNPISEAYLMGRRRHVRRRHGVGTVRVHAPIKNLRGLDEDDATNRGLGAAACSRPSAAARCCSSASTKPTSRQRSGSSGGLAVSKRVSW